MTDNGYAIYFRPLLSKRPRKLTTLREALALSLDGLVAVTRTDVLTTGLIYPSKKPRRRKRTV
jgi:hypothetical protein